MTTTVLLVVVAIGLWNATRLYTQRIPTMPAHHDACLQCQGTTAHHEWCSLLPRDAQIIRFPRERRPCGLHVVRRDVGEIGRVADGTWPPKDAA